MARAARERYRNKGGKAYSRRYYQANRDRINERVKQRTEWVRLNQPEKHRLRAEYQRRYRDKLRHLLSNPEKRIERINKEVRKEWKETGIRIRRARRDYTHAKRMFGETIDEEQRAYWRRQMDLALSDAEQGSWGIDWSDWVKGVKDCEGFKKAEWNDPALDPYADLLEKAIFNWYDSEWDTWGVSSK